MDIITIVIEKPAAGGYGLGFHSGKAVFVPYAVPNDRAEIRVTQEKKDHCFGVIQRLIEPSPMRIIPECENFGICGGCDYQNINYADELNIKKKIISEHLKRIAGLSDVSLPEIAVVSSSRHFYRSHAAVKCAIDGAFGFFQKESNVVVPFPAGGCLLLHNTLTRHLKNPCICGDRELKIALDSAGKIITPADVNPVVREIENEILYDRRISCFFQVNLFLRKTMIGIAENYLSPDTDSLLDIGCGVGFFTLYFAKKNIKTAGIDSDKESIYWARHNAALNKIENVIFLAESASSLHPEKFISSAMLLDPPRSGMSFRARKTIAAIAPKQIIYVSCNPATFARDIRAFANSGYRLDKLTMIDLFPATHHSEVIGLLSRC